MGIDVKSYRQYSFLVIKQQQKTRDKRNVDLQVGEKAHAVYKIVYAVVW